MNKPRKQEAQSHHGLPSFRKFGFFHKQWELMIMLPEVAKLRDIFDLFVVSGQNKALAKEAEGDRCLDLAASIELSDVADCLRTMGLSPGGDWLARQLAEQLRRREEMGPLGARIARRASFELVLTLYCKLAARVEGPTAEDVLQVLRSCDPKGTGVLPYCELRHMLTTMGDRLDEAEVFSVLHGFTDIGGNVHYEHLVRQMFANDLHAEEALQQAGLYLQAVGRNAIDMDMDKRDQFIEALRRADPLSSGFIQPDRLLELLNGREERFTGEELQLLTQGMEDTRCERGINYRRFLRFIMNE
ncbi:myosin light chain, embryonic [Drosophila rhopaloa]|uniref:Myosin light chain, embryonic n=1 Tax=Drosophila rhopaloa TaxID=1041015 RepID=A0A6P4FGD5_DRORH|nr:myosin light chain, embryonic [Drosophila rhopaloa]